MVNLLKDTSFKNAFLKAYDKNCNPKITQKDLGNKCVHCKNDTSYGSGRFVNRYPAETDELIGYCCDECEQNYYKYNPQTEAK